MTADTLNYFTDGEPAVGVGLRSNNSFALSAYLGFILDGAVATAQTNLVYSLLKSDSLDVENMTYDAGNDRYDCDTGATATLCTAITPVSTATSTAKSNIARADSTIAGTSTLTIQVSHDDGANWTSVTERELADITNSGTGIRLRFVFTRSVVGSTDRLSAYGSYYG